LAAQAWVVVACLQALFLWTGLQPLLGASTWHTGLGVIVGALLAGAVVPLLLHRVYVPATTPGTSPVPGDAVPTAAPRPEAASVWGWVGRHGTTALAGVFLFVFNAVPTADVQLGNFQYTVFSSRLCYLQYLGLLGAVASIAASVVFGAVFRNKRVSFSLMLTAILAAVASLVALPFVRLADPAADLPRAFGWASLLTLARGFFGELAFLPALVLATQHTPRRDAGFVYGLFLSFIDFGDTVSGLATAPVVAALGITSTDWRGLQALVVIAAAARVAALGFVPLLLCTWPKAAAVEDAEAERQLDAGDAEDSRAALLN
jgi:hypothetical protein